MPVTLEEEVPPSEAGPSVLTRLFGISAFGPFVALILVGEFFALKSDHFLTGGNLSRHLQVLEEAGLVQIEKGYEGRRPRTWAHITKDGSRALARELRTLKEIVAGLEGAAVASP